MQYVGLQGVLSESRTIRSPCVNFANFDLPGFWRENVVRSKSLSIPRWSFYKLVPSLFNKLRNISYKFSRFLLSTFIFYSQYIFAPEIAEMVWSATIQNESIKIPFTWIKKEKPQQEIFFYEILNKADMY